MTLEPLLMAYLRVLEEHGWVELPTREGGTSVFTRGTHLLDRIQIVRGRWSHHHFDRASWPVKARGDNAVTLEEYLTKHFSSGGR